ncbi:MAG: tetratricopeptide repeat protein, partial [Candidatus Heimdallarchaeota archaeon]
EENFFLLNNISQFKYAEILIAQNNYPIAIEILKELSEKEKLNIFADKSLFLLAQVYEFGISDRKTAKSIYENLLANFPNSLYLDETRESIKRLKTI